LLQCIGCCDSGELNPPISDKTVVVDSDEISFLNVMEMQKLDKQLKGLTSRHDVPYGRVSIVFSGDFHQLQPICESDKILYSCLSGALAWGNSVNCAIFLENSHRFKDDPEYGAILGRMRMGKDTKEDREKINTRVTGKCGVQVPARSWIDTYCTVCMYVDFFWNARARGDVTVALQWRYMTLHNFK